MLVVTHGPMGTVGHGVPCRPGPVVPHPRVVIAGLVNALSAQLGMAWLHPGSFAAVAVTPVSAPRQSLPQLIRRRRMGVVAEVGDAAGPIEVDAGHALLAA